MTRLHRRGEQVLLEGQRVGLGLPLCLLVAGLLWLQRPVLVGGLRGLRLTGFGGRVPYRPRGRTAGVISATSGKTLSGAPPRRAHHND